MTTLINVMSVIVALINRTCTCISTYELSSVTVNFRCLLLSRRSQDTRLDFTKTENPLK